VVDETVVQHTVKRVASTHGKTGCRFGSLKEKAKTMQVNGPANVHGPQSLKGPHFQPTNGTKAARPAAGPSDQLDISPAAEAAVQASEKGGVRADLVARVRGEIAAGTYETAEKLDVALSRAFDQLG